MNNSTLLRRITSFIVIVVPLFLLSRVAAAQEVAKTLTASNGELIGFLQYTPTDYDANPNTKYPLIIFLHGIGERGNGTTDIWNIAGPAIPGYIRKGHPMRFYWNGKWETFLVLAPQLNSKYGGWQDFYVDEMLKYAKANLRIDPDRIILTGLSLGGGGVWHYASSSAAHAQEFAAIAPVCGTCSIQNPANIVNANLPVWAFHAQNDGTVGVGCTTGAISSINNLNPAVVPLMTIYPDGGHGIWDRAFDTVYNWQNPNIYEWFLGQNRSKPVNKLPVANAGPDQNITTGLAQITLNASGSSDPDGNIVRYIWKQISGPATGVIKTPLGINSLVTGLITVGTYKFQLTVVDDRCGQSSATVTINVSLGPVTGNQPPVANAGADKTITLPTSSATLNGSGSDPNNDITSYTWTKINGPSQFTIGNPSSASTTVSNLIVGTYTFRLTVKDATGLSDYDDVLVTVNNTAPGNNTEPVAVAGPDINLTLPANSTTLDGSGSYDPDGNITKYGWIKISGPSQFTLVDGAAAKTTLSNLVQGTYVFRLVVTDNGGYTDNDTIAITVSNQTTPPANEAPHARAGNDISITLPVNSTTLDGSASTDPDGSISGYSWIKLSGPASYTLSNSKSAATAVSNLVQGTYVFQLEVTDNGGLKAYDDLTVTVNAAPNQAPTANAGNNISITLPVNSTTLNGSASTDPDGSISSYSWTKVSGPATYTLANASSASTALSNLSQGTYVFRLEVTDNGGLKATDDVTITVNAAPAVPPANQAPTANAGNNISITLPTSSTTLNGSASTDPDGSISSYNWTKLSGPASYTLANAGAASTAVSNLAQGTYVFRLEVTDNGGLKATDDVTVTVNPKPNQKPTANAGSNISITLPTNSTTLNGSGSTDADGSISGYTWSKVSGPTSFTLSNAGAASPTLSNLVQGTYVFRLLVTDNGGLTDDDSVIVTVNPKPNELPVAKAGSDFTVSMPNPTIKLDGTASYDPDGSIASYNWRMVSGGGAITIVNSTTATPSIVGVNAIVYVFELTVTDNNGATAKDQVRVTVNAAPNQAPVADAGRDSSLALPASTSILNGSGSSDPDGQLASYAWRQVSGPSEASIANAAAVITDVTGLETGDYLFELTVTDDRGSSARDSVAISVVNTLRSEGSLTLYPNPVVGNSLNLRCLSDSLGQARINIYEMNGRVVHSEMTNKSQTLLQKAVDIAGLKSGTYLLEVLVGENSRMITKFIKQ